MKGFTGLEIVIAVSAFTVFLILFVIVPLIALRITFETTVRYEIDHDNAELGLLTFLSSTENGKPVSQIIANHLAFNDPQNIDFLKKKMDKIFICYELKSESKTLIKGSCNNPQKSEASLEIALPYGMYKSVLTLVIG